MTRDVLPGRFLLLVRNRKQKLLRVEIESVSEKKAQDIAEQLSDIRISELIKENQFESLKSAILNLE